LPPCQGGVHVYPRPQREAHTSRRAVRAPGLYPVEPRGFRAAPEGEPGRRLKSRAPPTSALLPKEAKAA